MAKEKEDLGHTGAEEEDNERVVAMEREITEKEEILNRLLETVKGFGPMKNEYEKLLTQISALEVERRELENELEKAKRAAEGNSSSSSAVAEASVTRMRERYVKVQGELTAMRKDRSQKENAFKIMQRGTQQCDALQRELKKLKEIKVQLVKQQKQQSLQFQKLKKEQELKLQNFKKSDVKKQQLMNSLKTEVERKERLLGLKAREMSRIHSKLRAAEGHIQSLLRTQVKNRMKWAASSSAPSGPGKGDDTGKTSGNKFGLSADDYNHFQSAKVKIRVCCMNNMCDLRYCGNLIE